MIANYHNPAGFQWWWLSVAVFFPFCCLAGELSGCLKKVGKKDSVCCVWVIFSEKPSGTPGSESVRFPSRTLARRARAGFKTFAPSDIPVSPHFIKEIQEAGGRLRNVFPWANAASFSMSASRLDALAMKKCVKKVLPLRSFHAKIHRSPAASLGKTAQFPDSGSYGVSLRQMRMDSIPQAHNYINNTLKAPPGDGVLIGLFDSGFRLNHHCFGYLKSHQSIMADSNFVDHNGELSDPDSIRRVFLDDAPEVHGSQTLGLLGAYDPGKFLGVAWGARFVLAKTEWVGRIINNTEIDIEVHGEEDNWASALFWAESLGVDVVSSSLAYRTDFTDSMGNDRTQDDYTYADLDGKTTIIARAALEATKRGVLIVNAVGNDGSLIPGPGSLNTPADVEGVVAVGAVYLSKSICEFSSRGPTADGRIKPDVVTLGDGVCIPDIYSADSGSYTYGSGTSFAAPVVAGVCALIRQTHPADSAAQLRRLLFASCNFAPLQDSVDNDYGRGIPNAFRACYNDSLTPVKGVYFSICPTTLDIIRKKQQLTLTFKAQADDPLHYSQQFTATVRSVSGKLVWSHSAVLKENRKLQLAWPETQKSYAPGMYYFIINYAGKTHIRKFIILG